MLDKFRKQESVNSGSKPHWQDDSDGMQIVSVNAQPQQQEQTKEERIEVDAEKVVNAVLDLGTKKGVALYQDRKHPNIVEYRWISGRVVHRYRIAIQDVKLIKLRV